jgi:hypothetical protein
MLNHNEQFERSHHIGLAIGKLEVKLFAAQRELATRETSQGKSHDVRKMNQLRVEIESLEKRLRTAATWQDAVLSGATT